MQDSDLEEPLIVHAADYAEAPLLNEKYSLLAPVWSPASQLQGQ